MSDFSIVSPSPILVTSQTSTAVKKEIPAEVKNITLQKGDLATINNSLSNNKVPSINVLEEKKSSAKSGAKVGAVVGAIGGAGLTAPIAFFATAFGNAHSVGGLLLKLAGITAAGGAVGAVTGAGFGAGIGALYGAIKGE